MFLQAKEKDVSGPYSQEPEIETKTQDMQEVRKRRHLVLQGIMHEAEMPQERDMDLTLWQNYIEVGKATPSLCPDCSKKCRNRRGCLIGQIIRELALEGQNIAFMAISMKLPKGITEGDIEFAISTARDYRNRYGSFGKAFWGMVKCK